MEKLTEKEQDFLFKALADFYVKTNTDKCPYETYMKAIALFDYLDTPTEEKIRYNSPDEKDVCVAHMLALHYAVLALGINCDCGTECFLYSGLFLAISNTIVAIIKLAEDGLDYQAMSLIRNLFELFMTLLIVTESSPKRAAFISANKSEEDRKVWHQYFTKKKFQQMLKAYCDTHPDLKEVVEDCQRWIDETYEELSSYTHSDYPHLACGSLSQYDDNGYLRPNIWGQYITGQKKIYSHLYTVASPAHHLFCYMLKDLDNEINIDYLFGNTPKGNSKLGKEIVFDLQCILESLSRHE